MIEQLGLVPHDPVRNSSAVVVSLLKFCCVCPEPVLAHHPSLAPPHNLGDHSLIRFGATTHIATPQVETLKATVDSMMVWGLIRPRPGVENYSWKGNKIDGLKGCVNSKAGSSVLS
eukprot:COSAG06_NODE_1492_length_9279_cov_835.540632_13_plen_116_part_00